MTASYTHTGRRGYTGHYAVTTDAIRTPGRTHALNHAANRRDYIALCGVTVSYGSDDAQIGVNPVRPASEGGRVTCKRCRKLIGG
jgi:hypothetical protein